jgi:putative DNA primase/helicase
MSSEIRKTLNELYPGPWALRLVALCRPKGPHEHSGRPCKSPGKAPVESDWVAQADRRSEVQGGRDAHLARIAGHISRGGNVGLALPRGVVALDADTEQASAWLDTALPDAPFQQTQRGNHFLVRVPGRSVSRNRTKVGIVDGVDVDVRAHGSQIVAEPSIHEAGTAYCWKRPLPRRLEKLPEAPGLIRRTLEGTSVQQAHDASRERIIGDSIREGERNVRLTSIAGGLRRQGCSREEIEEILLAINARRGRPPLPEGEVRQIAKSVSRYEGGRGAASEEAPTELGNARRLVRRHGRDLRYCADLARWYVWDGRRWAEDKTGEVMRRAKDTVRSIFAETAAVGNDRKRDALGKHALASQRERTLRAMVSLAASEPEIVTTSDRLDSAPGLLNVENGTLDLESLELRPHRREDLLSKIAPVRFEPEARNEVWERFLERTLPDPELRAFAQKAVGYTLLGRADRDVVLMIHGPPRTGKGSFQDAIAAMLGQDYAATAGLADFAQRRFQESGPRPELVRLRGARMVNIYETSARLRLSASLVKTLAGGDTISARGLHQSPIEFRPQFAIWIASNHRPRLPDDDAAIWERMREIPFREVIPEEDRDLRLRTRLRTDPQVRSAILTWAIAGVRALRSEGFDPPVAVRAATRDYREAMDPLNEFLEERCELRPEEEDCFTTAAELREAYREWCAENERRPISAKAMGPRLRSRGCVRDRQRVDGKRQHIWRGLQLLARDEA